MAFHAFGAEALQRKKETETATAIGPFKLRELSYIIAQQLAINKNKTNSHEFVHDQNVRSSQFSLQMSQFARDWLRMPASELFHQPSNVTHGD